MNKFFGLFLFLFSSLALAQEYENLLDEVLIQGNNLSSFDQDWGIKSIDTIPILTLKGSDLTQLLEQNSLGGLRARSGVSTVSFRGLLSSHTQMLWNGIPLQSPSLGVIDVSTFPSSVYQDAAISMGGSSALYGSGAIGGTIHLEDKIGGQKGGFLTGGYRNGSYGLNAFHLGGGAGNRNTGFELQAYRTTDKNEFTYVNSARLDNPTQTMQNAGYGFIGLKGSLYQRIGKGKAFLNFWAHAHDQDLQQPMTSNGWSRNNRQQQTQSLRAMVGYRNEANPIWYDVRIGIVQDELRYQRDLAVSNSKTRNLVFKSEVGKRLSEKTNLLLGFQQQFITAEIEDYHQRPTEGISSLYFSLDYLPIERWRLTISARQTLWQGNLVPFSPEVQSDFRVFASEKSRLNFLAKASYNYRLPTLNDQYWDPGGNPNVRPERSIYTEAGLLFSHNGSLQYSLGITAFFTRVRDLLVWLPLDSVWSSSANDYLQGSAWGVINQDEMTSKGIELSGSLRRVLAPGWIFETGFAWSPLRSRADRPTLYVPYQTGLFNATIGYKRILVRYSLKFTGQRPAIAEDEFLDPYTLQYLETIYAFQSKKLKTDLFFRVDNLADVSYQSYQWYAMPGRRFSIGFNFFIK